MLRKLNTLNGWRRLWLALFILFSIPMVILAYLSRPFYPFTVDKNEWSQFISDENLKKDLLSREENKLKIQIDDPILLFTLPRPKYDEDKKDRVDFAVYAVASAYSKALEEKKEQYAWLRFVFYTIVYFIIFFAIYCFGRLVSWVIKGFSG